MLLKYSPLVENKLFLSENDFLGHEELKVIGPSEPLNRAISGEILAKEVRCPQRGIFYATLV